jgi:excisionase family DNA binding protein
VSVQRVAYSVPEAAELLGGVHPNTVWSLLRRGELRRVKVGTRTLIPASSIEAFVNGEGPAFDGALPDESDARSDGRAL